MKYFENITSLDELKKVYRRLAMQHHPDRGGSTEIMKEINREHDALFETLKTQHNAKADQYHKTTETPEEFRNIIEVLLKLDGLEVELCGAWLWIGGNTKKHKSELKKAGCRWSNNKKLWYWRHPEDGAHWSKGRKSIGEIRAKYGSQVFEAGRETTNFQRLEA